MFVPVTRFNRGQLSGKWGGRHVHHKSFYLQYSHKEQNLMGLDMTESGRKVCFHCTKHWSVHFIKHMKWNTLRNLEKKKSFSAESQAHLFFMYGSFWLWKSWSVQLELFLRYIGLKIVLCSLWSLSAFCPCYGKWRSDRPTAFWWSTKREQMTGSAVTLTSVERKYLLGQKQGGRSVSLSPIVWWKKYHFSLTLCRNGCPRLGELKRRKE